MRVHFDAPRGRRWRWAALGAVGLLSLLLLAWLGRSPRGAPPTVITEPLAKAPAPATASAPEAPVSAPAAPAVASTARAIARPGPADARLEVCGRGRMSPDDIERVLGPESAAARQQTVAVLLQGAERERLLGLLMGAQAAAIAAAQAQTQPCAPEDRACAQAAWQRQLAATAPMAEAAVQLALASRDAALYGAAFVHACRGGDVDPRAVPPSCARMSAADWQQRDPGDATAAWWAAHAALARGDAAAADAALAAALRAPRWSWPAGLLVSTLQAHTGFQAAPAPQRLDLLVEVQGLSLGGGFLSVAPLLQKHACTPQALADPARRERCEALVGRLLAESPSLLDVALAARAAEGLGWPADRIRAAQDQKLALQQALRPAQRFEDLYTCDGIARQMRQTAAWATFGEAGAARRAIAASGRPLAEWAAEARADAARRDAAFPAPPQR